MTTIMIMIIKGSWDVKTSELRTNRNDKGWCAIYNTLCIG